MTRNSSEFDELLRCAGAGDEHAQSELFALHRSWLRTMLRMRLDRRLAGRMGVHWHEEQSRLLDPGDQRELLDFRAEAKKLCFPKP